MVVAIAVGREGLNTLLVASQVVLSIVLPFVAFPLIYLTSSKSIMRVGKPVASQPNSPTRSPPNSPTLHCEDCEGHTTGEIDANTSPGTILDDGNPATICVVEKVNNGVVQEKQDVVLSNPVADEDSVPGEVDIEFVDYSNGWLTTVVVSLIFFVVLAANIYVIVMLGLGNT